MAHKKIEDFIFQRKAYKGRLYALVDAAFDERIYPLLKQYPQQCACLFHGYDLPRDVVAAAPHLVTMTAGHRLTDALQASDFPLVYVCSYASLANLVLHFRKFINARDRNGHQYYFRFYDPRVFAVFLPSCDRQQLAQWFDCVHAYVCMDMGTQTATHFDYQGGLLLCEGIKAQ